MKYLPVKYLVIPLLSMACFTAFANTQEDVKQVVMKNIESTEKEDLIELMGTIHSQSKGYNDLADMMKAVFQSYDLKSNLVAYHFIGEDEDYAYVKVRKRTEKVSGAEFKNNEVETLHVLKKENGEWKFWSQSVLSSKFF